MSSIEELSSRLTAVEARLDEHIHDGIEVWKGIEAVKTDITWIKRGMWALVTVGSTIGACLVKYVLAKSF